MNFLGMKSVFYLKTSQKNLQNPSIALFVVCLVFLEY